jgi:hypothetical protein
MGAGKTSLLAEASDILRLRDITHAAIDLDAFGLAHLGVGAVNDGVMYRNLRSVCENYRAAGVRRVLLARAIESRAELELCRGAVAAKECIVCLLTASVATMESRVRARESGLLQREFVARVVPLNATLEAARLQEFTVVNENRSLADVAREMLVKARWLPH